MDGEGQGRDKATIKLTPSASQPTIDLILTDGVPDGEKGNVLMGIYEFIGDQLIICFTDPKSKTKRNTRPTEFRAGNDTFLITLERLQTPAEVLKTLQGSWKTVRLVSRGEDAPADAIAKSGIVVKEDQFEVTEGVEKRERMTIKLTPGQTPCEINLTFVTPDEVKGETMLGIYELKGDTLTLCLRNYKHRGDGRPKEFQSDNNTALMVYKREPKK